MSMRCVGKFKFSCEAGKFASVRSNGAPHFVCMSKRVRNKSIQVSKEPNKPSDGLVAAKQAAAKLVITDLNLCLKFAKTALDLYEAGNREEAKTAKAAARRDYQTILKFMPKDKSTEAETRLIETKLGDLEQALKRIRRV